MNTKLLLVHTLLCLLCAYATSVENFRGTDAAPRVDKEEYGDRDEETTVDSDDEAYSDVEAYSEVEAYTSDEPPPADFKYEHIPECLVSCVEGLKECRHVLEGEAIGCPCAEKAAREYPSPLCRPRCIICCCRCNVEEVCSENEVVKLVHIQSSLCGLPVTDPVIAGSNSYLCATGLTGVAAARAQAAAAGNEGEGPKASAAASSEKAEDKLPLAPSVTAKAAGAACVDLPGKNSGKKWTDGESECTEYSTTGWCDKYGTTDYSGEGSAKEICCICGGGNRGSTTPEVAAEQGTATETKDTRDQELASAEEADEKKLAAAATTSNEIEAPELADDKNMDLKDPMSAYDDLTEKPTEAAVSTAHEEAEEKPTEEAVSTAHEEAEEKPTEAAVSTAHEEAEEKPTKAEEEAEEKPTEAAVSTAHEEAEEKPTEAEEEAEEKPTEAAVSTAHEEAEEKPTEAAVSTAHEEAEEKPTEAAASTAHEEAEKLETARDKTKPESASDEPEIVQIEQDKHTRDDGPLSTVSNKQIEAASANTAKLSIAYDQCKSELEELTSKQQEAVSKREEMLNELMTLGGIVQPPPANEQMELAESNELLREHIKRHVAASVRKACKKSSDQSEDAEQRINKLQQKKDNFERKNAALTTKIHKLEKRHKVQKAEQEQQLESNAKQLKQLQQHDSELESQLYKFLAEVQPDKNDASPIDGGVSVIEQLRAAFENQESEPKDWSELADQLLEHHRTVRVEGMTDPAAVGGVYLVVTLPVMGLVCLSRFASVKEIFIVQGVFANCCLTGIWLILAVLALYCGFNPLKLIIGHQVHLPTFELVFIGAYAYVTACNVLLLFVKRGALEKLHAFFTLVLGVHMYWMLYTLRTEELGSEIQVMFYFVYFVCFAGFSLAKLQGLTALHFGSVTNARRAKQASRAGKGTVVPISDDKGAAIFELGEDWEADGLTATSSKIEWKADFD